MSEIKVNKLSSRTGNAVTLGTSGDTFTIPAGVTLTNSGTATGFGSDSDISWQAVKTADFTAVAGEGYFVDSSGGTKTVTLPASPSAGDTVAINALDGSTNAVTIARNSSNIEGGTDNLTLSVDYGAITLIYSDAANGWVRQTNSTPDTFVSATGGTVSTSGVYKIHTFNSSSNFVVSSLSGVEDNNIISYMVVAGGAGGGWDRAGGGGAGGFREGKSSVDDYTASPLNAPAGITVTASTYPITVGAGGAGGTNGPQKTGVSGSDSVFSTITSGGGGGGGAAPGPQDGGNGGSGGGTSGPSTSAGSGNTPPVSPSQGNNGGTAPAPGGNDHGAGGGGATATGTPGAGSTGGAGGAGGTTSISGSAIAYSGGGGGGGSDGGGGPLAGGAGGSSVGGTGGSHPGGLGTAGTTNRGGGGGGGSNGPNSSPAGNGGAGGSGVVILRYKYQ